MDKKELDPAAGMSLALALFALHLKQHTQVDKMTAVGRNLVQMMLVTGCLSVVAVLAGQHRRTAQATVSSPFHSCGTCVWCIL